MSTGEIISIIAVCLSFLGVKERSQERELNVVKITNIENSISNICGDIQEIKRKIDKIDETKNSDHEKIIEHETRIKNLEKEVFRKGA